MDGLAGSNPRQVDLAVGLLLGQPAACALRSSGTSGCALWSDKTDH